MTVKIRGEQLTLHSQRTLGASSAPTQVGDRVVLLIDPRAVGIRSVEGTVEMGQSSHGNSGHDATLLFSPKGISDDLWPPGGAAALIVGHMKPGFNRSGYP